MKQFVEVFLRVNFQRFMIESSCRIEKILLCYIISFTILLIFKCDGVESHHLIYNI